MIVDCAAYEGGCRIADVALDQVGEWSKREGTFVWVGLFEPTEEELHTVQGELGLHDLAIEDAHAAHQRPKIEEYGDGVFMVLRTARWNAEKRKVVRGETHVFLGPCYVVSIRHGDTASYSAVRTRCQATPHHLALGPGFVLYAILDFVVDNYFPIIDALEDRIEILEKHIFGDRVHRDTTRRIYDIKRRLIMVKRSVSPLVESATA